MKSDKAANNFRVKGDEQLQNGNFSEALESYNNCLRFATSKSAESSAAFAARAKVFFKTARYKECIENNASVEQVNNLIEEMEYLSDIEEKSKINESEREKWDFFKLTHTKNEKIPFIADCLEVRENEIYGRFIATTKDLAPGDIVIIEEPFYKVLSVTERSNRCAVCLKQNALNLMPCSKCSTGRCIFLRRM
jgi:hypothetical protein